MGRLPTGKTPQHAIKLLRGKHREIMRREIAGEKYKDIAMDMGLTQSRLSIIVNSPLYKKEKEKLEEEIQAKFTTKTADIQEEVREIQPKALQLLKDIVNKTDVDGLKVSLPLKKETALDLLDLGGNGKRNSVNGNNGKGGLGDALSVIRQGFDLAQEAIKERERRNTPENPGGIIDVTPEEAGIQRQVIPEQKSAIQALEDGDLGFDENENKSKSKNKTENEKENLNITTETQVTIYDAAVAV